MHHEDIFSHILILNILSEDIPIQWRTDFKVKKNFWQLFQELCKLNKKLEIGFPVVSTWVFQYVVFFRYKYKEGWLLWWYFEWMVHHAIKLNNYQREHWQEWSLYSFPPRFSTRHWASSPPAQLPAPPASPRAPEEEPMQLGWSRLSIGEWCRQFTTGVCLSNPNPNPLGNYE